MNALHLLWIVPVCTLYGFLVNCLFASNKEKKNTNGNRIRAMSDEDLVKLFGHNSICDYVQDHSREHCEKQGSCDKCLVKWLQQPAGE